MKALCILLWINFVFLNFSFSQNYTYTSDSVGVLDSIITQRFNDENEVWINQTKTEYVYSEDKKTELSYNWNSDNQVWREGNSSIEYKYDENGKLVDILVISNIYGPVDEQEFEYDTNGNQIIYIYSRYWSVNTEEWRSRERYEYEYDINDNKILQLDYYWSSYSGSDCATCSGVFVPPIPV